ncbi:hypothetical protein EV424DRAFT_1426513 [Suillus variegatus]|nr:hypothetical protein EV424DRAFT_1426513 [Suillus variegatus]
MSLSWGGSSIWVYLTPVVFTVSNGGFKIQDLSVLVPDAQPDGMERYGTDLVKHTKLSRLTKRFRYDRPISPHLSYLSFVRYKFVNYECHEALSGPWATPHPPPGKPDHR